MNERKRDLAVGIFVLLGALALGGLILAFSNIATVLKMGYVINAHMDHASGMSAGRMVHYRGLRVGEVEEVYFDEGLQLVVAKVRIRESELRIPAGAVMFTAPATFGDVFIDIRVPDDRRAMEGHIPSDGTGIIPGQAAAPAFLPEGLVEKLESALEGFGEMETLMNNLVLLTEPRRLDEVRRGEKPPNISSTVERLDDSIARIASDENVENIGRSLATMRAAADRLQSTMENVDRLIESVAAMTETATGAVTDVQRRSAALLEQMTEDALILQRTLLGVNDLVAGVQRGEGTIGRLLRSDQLHREFELTIIQARQALRDFSRLSTKLEEEGLLRRGG